MEIHEPEDLNIDYLVNYWSYLSFDRFENVAIFTNSYLKINLGISNFRSHCFKITQNIALEFWHNFCLIKFDLSGNTV